MHGAEFLGPADIHAKTIRTEAGYPGLVPGTGCVGGELYQIPESLLPALDAYEGPGYERRLGPVIHDGQETQAWAYWLR